MRGYLSELWKWLSQSPDATEANITWDDETGVKAVRSVEHLLFGFQSVCTAYMDSSQSSWEFEQELRTLQHEVIQEISAIQIQAPKLWETLIAEYRRHQKLARMTEDVAAGFWVDQRPKSEEKWDRASLLEIREDLSRACHTRRASKLQYVLNHPWSIMLNER